MGGQQNGGAALVHFRDPRPQLAAQIDIEPRAYGTHRLRQTKVALVYKKVGNLRARQLLLGHRKLESTVRDLGIEVEREISAP